jgi:hypothetical protein
MSASAFTGTSGDVRESLDRDFRAYLLSLDEVTPDA